MEMSVPDQVVRAADVPALIVTPHPVSLQGQRRLSAAAAEFTPGESLASLLERQGVRPGQQWVVTIDGLAVPDAMWSRTRPKHGYLIECRRVPEKDVLRIIAIAALSYFTLGAGGIAGGSFFGLTGAAGWIAAGATFLAGSLVLNKLLAPKMPSRQDQQASPSYSLTASRNRMRPFEPMALVMGEPYIVPDMAGQPYTYFAGGEQFLWQLFHLGINCAEITNLRIGQTPLANYQDFELLRSGLASNNSAFPALGTSVDTIAGQLLSAPVAPGDWVTRTGTAGTMRIGLDFAAQLYATNRDGAFVAQGVDLTIEYRPVGSSTWLPFTEAIIGVPPTRVWIEPESESGVGIGYWLTLDPGTPSFAAGALYLENASQKPLRVTIERSVPLGQYEVRIRKTAHADLTGVDAANAVEWTQMRCYQQDLASYDGQARLALRIQASGQLNGTIDELNGVARAAAMPCWNGSAWVTATDRGSGLCNPGAIFLLLCRGIFDSGGRRLAGLGYSDDQIDIEGLKRFMVHCAEHGFEFDYALQESMGLQELLDAIAYAGMGEIGYPDGRIGVVFFRADDPVEGVINMANIRARSFSVSYDTMPTADEIEFQYVDRDRGHAWKSLRVRAPGVTNPRSTARQPIMGVTREAHAATLARFSMAQNIFQRKTVSLEMDLEYMTYRRGAVVALSHDLTQWGFSGRLVACEDVAGEIHLTLDEPVPADNPAGGAGTRYIGLRLPGEQQMRAFPVQAFTGVTRELVLDVEWPDGVPLPGVGVGDPAHDTLWVFDFKAVPGQRLQVVDITPSANGARLSLAPIGPEFWDFVFNGAYTPPPSGSLLRPPPTVQRVIVSEQLARQGHAYYTELFLSADIDGAFIRAELWGGVADGDFAPTLQLLAQGTSQTLQWRGGLDERWHLELRVFSEIHQAAPYRLIYDVQGLRIPPPNVEAVSVSGNTITWTPVDVPDLAGYLLRFNYGVDSWWESATPLHEGVITASPYDVIRRPQGLVTILVKAVDTTGNESAEATRISYVFPEVLVDNVLLDYPQHPAFPGAITGGSVISDELVADDADAFWDPPAGSMYSPGVDAFYGASQYGALSYEFAVTSPTAGTLVLLYQIAGGGFLIEYQVGGGEPFYETPDTDPFWEPADDLLYGPASAWAVWPGAVDVDGSVEVRFRITLVGGLTQGVISELSAVLDVPDVVERLDEVAISAAGTRLPITETYHAIRTVQLTVQGGGAGISARYLDKNPTLGPLVEILNAAGTSVDGVLDADVQGY